MNKKLNYSTATFKKTETLLKCLEAVDKCYEFNRYHCLIPEQYQLFECDACPLQMEKHFGSWMFVWEDGSETYSDTCIGAYRDIIRELDARGVKY